MEPHLLVKLRSPLGNKVLKSALNQRQYALNAVMASCTAIMKTTCFWLINGTIQNMLLSASWCVALLLGCNALGHKCNTKPRAQCVSDQLSGLPAVPNLPQEPLTPPVGNWMDMVFAVLVEGKAPLLITLRSLGLQAHDRSHLLCWLNCKYTSVHEHCMVIIMGAGLGFYVKYWCMRDRFGAEWHCFDVRVKVMVLLVLGCNNYKIYLF